MTVDTATFDDSLHGYSNILRRPLDRSNLFNAIHASGICAIDNCMDTLQFCQVEQSNTEARNLKILIAEDNKTNQLVITKILERRNHQPCVVNNGQEALEILENNRFDLIIMDMQMPVMGGIEAAKIYNHSTTREDRAPIIILTANATIEASKECEAANIDAYLTKPINVNSLLSTIEKLTSNSKITGYKEHNSSTDTQKVPDSQALPILDIGVLDNLRMLTDDISFVPSLIGGYIDDTKNQIAQMETAIANKQYAIFRELQHAMKGSSGSVGALRLHNQCKGNQNTSTDDRGYIQTLKNITIVFAETEKKLSDYLRNHDKVQEA
jgi:two-component system sensor histidine kinase RpfC